MEQRVMLVRFDGDDDGPDPEPPSLLHALVNGLAFLACWFAFVLAVIHFT